MAIGNVPATRGNLMRLKKELDFVSESSHLLEEKRDVLVHEVMALLDEAERLREQVQETLREAYTTLRLAHLSSGIETVRRAALAAKNTVTVEVRAHSVMGVPVPEVKVEESPEQLEYSFMEITPALDAASLAFRLALHQLCELAAVSTSLSRLVSEVQRTEKRVNALKKVFIPEYVEAIHRIEGALEEREREDVYVAKLGKER